MGCSQSRKDHSFTEDEIKKLTSLHLKLANSYPETKGKDDLCVQAFRDLFEENPDLGEKVHEFILKISSTKRIDLEIFIDAMELIIKKPTNQRLIETFTSSDKITLFCNILFPHLRKTAYKDESNQMHALVSYSEALDFNLCILRMLKGSNQYKINESTARLIADRVFPSDDGNLIIE